MIPVRGGVRRRRNKMPRSSGGNDSTVIKYSAIGDPVSTTAGYTKGTVATRPYIPGSALALAQSAGPTLVSYYSSARFLPGTAIRWEPSVAFTTSGRIVVGFTDNPEVASAINDLVQTFYTTPTDTTFGNVLKAVRGLGDVISFPVWQETNIPFPTKLRRKRFDVNATASLTDTNVLDRSLQTYMIAVLEGTTSAVTAGSLWYHDNVDVEGVTSTLT